MNMKTEYPIRPKAPDWVRYICMVFGLANMVGGVMGGYKDGLFAVIGGLVVGGAWFAFGLYGGLPLVDTTLDWHPPVVPGEIEETHRRGLLVMRRRRWMTWAVLPGFFVAGAMLIPIFMQIGHPELILFVLMVPAILIYSRYYLSRCPRCSYGFFTHSNSRAAMIRMGDTCGHCGLSLRAFKDS